MDVAACSVRLRRPFIKRLALVAVPALLSASLAVAATPSSVRAGGSLDAVTIQVLGGPLGDITSSPLTLSPAFARTTTDYVVHCHSGVNTIYVTLTAASAGKIAVGNKRGRGVTIEENLIENQALIIGGPAGRGSNEASAGGKAAQGDSEQLWGHAQYWIRCLPHDFPQLSVTGPHTAPLGWYLTGNVFGSTSSSPYEMVLDNNGTPVWYQKSIGPNALNVTWLSRTSIAWATNAGPGFGADPTSAFEVYDLNKQTTRQLRAPVVPTDPHELVPVANGHLMMLSSPLRPNVDLTALGLGPSGTIVDCVAQEVNRNGHLVWQWRASDHIGVGESTHPVLAQVNGQVVYDVYHCNSIDTDQDTGNVLISSRHTDAVYLVNKSSGVVIWKLGGTSSSRDHAQILKIQDDPAGAFHAQHDARFQSDRGISLYDDQSWNTSSPARGVEYRVNTAEGTATLIWSYKSPDGRSASATGSFRRLNGGNDNVIAWGFKPNTLFTEVDARGTVLLDVTFPNGELAYRAVKVEYGALDGNLLRASAGLPAQ